MTILDFITHPPFQYDLCKTRHEFHFAPSEMWDHWDESLRPLPANATILPSLPDPNAYDLIIAATREQYQRIAHSSAPKVFLSHTKLHPWDAEFFTSLPQDVQVVYVSDHKRRTFGALGRRGVTIPLGVDVEGEFGGFTGSIAAALSVTNRYADQADRGYPLFCEVTKDLAAQVVGHGNEAIAGAYPARDFEHLKVAYREHRCYLHTDLEGRLHLATLEALATGTPLATLPIADLEGLLIHGENGFVGSTPAELREALTALLADAELARRVGAAGRELVRQHFGLGPFLNAWDCLMREQARSPRGAISIPARIAASAPPRGLRIAINALSAAGTPTGIGHYSATLCNSIAELDVDHEFLLIRGPGESLLKSDPRVREVVIEHPDPMWEQLQLPPLLEELEVDVYHNPAFGLPLVKTCALVCTVHDCIPRLFPEYSPPWLEGFFRRWAPLWTSLADKIVTDSMHTSHDLLHLYGVPGGKSQVVYQAADPALQRVANGKLVAAVLRRYGIDKPYLLCVGRVELRKNVAGLLQAFRLLRERLGDGLALVFAGPKDADAYDPDGVLPSQGRSGDVIVTGYVPTEDLAALYTGAEVFCFPSFYEGFGRPVLEAMQCGAPVVTSPISSLPEVGGEAAVYANPYDPAALARTVETVLTDTRLRDDLRARGYARAAEFTPERAAKDMISVYEQAAGAT